MTLGVGHRYADGCVYDGSISEGVNVGEGVIDTREWKSSATASTSASAIEVVAQTAEDGRNEAAGINASMVPPCSPTRAPSRPNRRVVQPAR